jgi:NarL family two-component system response regulator LiaR
MGDRIRVVVVDDHDLLREGVVSSLRGFDDLEVVGEASNGVAALGIIESEAPDVVLIDLVMPGLGGIGLITRIRETDPDVGLLVLSSFAESKLVREALQAGADGYLVKSVDAEGLAHGIRSTARGQKIFAPEVRSALTERSGDTDDVLGRFTRREREIVDLLAQGMTNAEIAAELSVSIFTVKNHVSNILMKLHSRSRTEAVAVILRSGTRGGV